MIRLLILVPVLLFFFATSARIARAQGINEHLFSISIKKDTSIFLPDTVLLLPTTAALINEKGDSLPARFFTLKDQQITFSNLPDDFGPLTFYCRSLDPAFSRWYYRRNTLSNNSDSTATTVAPVQLRPEVFQLPDQRKLAYSGSFTRGFSFGNRQDLVLNSNFNLQMSGELGDDLQIRAAITDENIPLQAEGNTQQLQEFDQVFIELSKNNHRLKAGDYEIANGKSYFSRFFKKLQGITYNHQFQAKGLRINNEVSAALTRGKFTRTNLIPTEGNQGPYKLRGAQGERFVIILSGTERIWINGQLAKRGLEEDYIIDYNLGEITFTNKQLIRRESRILLEYEYVEQSYARSIISTKTTISTQKHQVAFQLFSQQDSRNTSGFFNLTEADRLALTQAGDDPSKTLVSSLRPLENFSPAQVAYTQQNTSTPCGTEQILVFSNDENAELQTATFSFVGEGNGLYQQAPADEANELVYKYVGRDSQNCQPLGNYSPSVQLSTPQSQQLLTVRDEWTINKGTYWHTEVAWSNHNLNRFSTLDAQDNQGLALFTNFGKEFGINSPKDAWKLKTDLSYEYKSTHFRALNPYRPPEFLRDWSLADFNGLGQTAPSNEHLITGNFNLSKAERGQLQYQLSSFIRPGDYQGIKHSTQLDYQHKSWQIQGNGSYLEASTASDQRQFFRPDLSLGYTLKQGEGWQARLIFSAEDRQDKSIATDTLLDNSYAFYSYTAEINSPDAWKNQLSFRYQQRQDLLPQKDRLTEAFTARELGLEQQWQWGRNLRLQSAFTYRDLELNRPDIPFSGKSGGTFLGRINSVASLAKGLIRSNINYNLSGGQEPERTFSYVRVRKGEGLYIWLDSLYNNDGIIQPNEMEISPFPDQAEYVRVSTFSDNFIQTNNVELNWSLQLSPRALLFNTKTAFGRFWGRFSTQSSLKISRRTQPGANVQPWNPFQLNVADTSLIATTAGTRHLLFFNRGQTDFDIQLGWSDTRRKFVQNTGFESRINASKFLKLRWKMADSWITNWTVQLDDRTNDSEFFNNKDFQIREQSLEPDIQWAPSTQLTWKASYRLSVQKDQLSGSPFQSRNHNLSTELNWNKDSRTRLEQRFSYINVDFSGQANSPVGFAMLNGLQPGNNLIWNLNLNRQLGRNLQLQLSYEGRKTGTARVVHVGRAQVSAIF